MSREPISVVNPPLEPDGPPSPLRHPPILSAYIASGLREAGFDVKILDLYHSGSGWKDRLRELPRGGRIVAVYRDYDRPIPTERFASAVATIADTLKSPILLAGLAGMADVEKLESLLSQVVQRSFPWYPESFLPRWLRESSQSTLDSSSPERWSCYPPGPPFPDVDIDSLPIPAWDLLDISVIGRGAPHRYRTPPVLPVLSIRGCPHKCAFCDRDTFSSGPTVVHRSPERVVEEIVLLQARYGIREVQFAQPNFALSKPWVLEMCGRLSQIRPRLGWSCQVRADMLDQEMAEAMADAGCWNILFGVESASPEVQRLAGKPLDLAHLEAVGAWCRKMGMETTASYIIGLPGDTPATVRDTIRFACRLDSDYAQFFIHKAVTDIPLALGDRICSQWDCSPFDIPGRPYIPAAFNDADQLRRFRAEAYRTFYLRPAFLLRKGRSLLNPVQARRMASGLAALARLVRR